VIDMAHNSPAEARRTRIDYAAHFLLGFAIVAGLALIVWGI
jgi:hypothetical protein